MERITRKLDDDRIAVRLDVDGYTHLERLWEYENTGFEPKEIAPRRERINLIELYKRSLAEQDESTQDAVTNGEATAPERIAFLLVVQEVFDKEYQIGYADGVNCVERI